MLNNLKIIGIILTLLLASCRSDVSIQKWVESLPKPWLISEAEISEILPQFNKRLPVFEDRLRAITLWRIGTPYELFKLGEESEPDTDPLFRLDVSDCTVHILTSLTLAQSKNWDEALENIVKIHYKNNIPLFSSRWHFTSDRILFNPYTVDITPDIINSDKLEKVDITLNIDDDGKEYLELEWSKKVELSYISNELINSELLINLPEICGIAFINKSYFKNGLAVAHEGILIDQNNFVHASSMEKQTVMVDFLGYYFTNGKPKFDGIIIYKFVQI